MKRLTLLFACFFISMGLAIAQNINVKGTVVDEAGEPVIGASVVVKESQAIGTVTNIDGKFSLDVPASSKTLVVKYLGMASVEVAVAPEVFVELLVSDAMLNEVIVTAYGTMKKSSFTGSTATVASATLEKRQVSNVTKALQGAVAGVQGTSLSGQPGSSATLRIRGIGSLSASSNPLFVVDGMPFDGNLNSINPMDIESITVMKDAAANSMYGARGANGVVLIATRNGQKGKSKVTFETRFGVNQRGIPAYDLVRDPGAYLELNHQALRNYATSSGTLNPGQWASDNLISNAYGTGGYNPYNVANNQVVLPDGTLNPNASLLYWDDWLKEPFSNGFRNEDVVTISGGNDNSTYYMSAGFLTDNSYIENSNFQRFSVRAKLDQKVTDWFKTGINVSYAKTDMDSPWRESSASAYANLFMFAQGIAPIYPIYQYDQNTGQLLLDADGGKMLDFGVTMGNRMYGANSNPLSTLRYDIRGTDQNQTSAIGFAEFTFLKDFTLLFDVGVENYSLFANSFQNPIAGDAANVKGRNTRESEQFFALQARQLLTWAKKIDVHNFNVIAGHESKSDTRTYMNAQKENFAIANNPELNNAARLLTAESYKNTYAIESYLARLLYDFNDKYYFSASIRRDASSRFHPDVRWGNFWALGGSWRVSSEDFMTGISWLNDLRFKISYGIQGNDNILRMNGYEDQFEVVSLDGGLGLSYVYRGNKDLKWEDSKNFNTGLEFSLFNRLRGGVEYFNRKSDNLLYAKGLALSLGDPTTIYTNEIAVTNSGFEVELNVDIIRTADLLWSVGGNITSLDNKLNKLPADRNKEGYRNGNYYFKEGNSIYDWYLYEYAGVDPTTGKSLWWKDVVTKNGDGTETTVSSLTSNYSEASYRENGKSAFNDFYGGVNTYVSYKGFDFSVLCSYAIGGYMLDSNYQAYMQNMDSPGRGVHKDAHRSWTMENQYTDVPKLEFGLQNQNATSDRWLTSRSYFSIQNLTLGYTLPTSLTRKLDINKLRFYVVADELYLNSARKGMDPRIYQGGTTTYAYSALRSMSIGLNVNF